MTAHKVQQHNASAADIRPQVVLAAVRLEWQPCCGEAWLGGPRNWIVGRFRPACPVHGTTAADHAHDAHAWVVEFGDEADLAEAGEPWLEAEAGVLQ